MASRSVPPEVYRQYQAILEHMAMDPALRSVLPRLKNMANQPTLRAILKQQMSEADAKAVAAAINYRTAAEVREALEAGARWLATQVGRSRYAIIATDPNLAFGTRSTQWLMSLIAKAVGRWPDAFVPDPPNPNALKTLLNNGIHKFVLLDDGVYSGLQIAMTIKAFAHAVAEIASSAHKYFKKPSLYVAVGFVSQVSSAYTVRSALNSAKSRLGAVKYHAVKQFRTVNEAMRIAGPNVVARHPNIFDSFLTLSMLAHKVPNQFSFPREIGNLLSYSLPQNADAPYKNVPNTWTDSARQVARAYWQGNRKGGRYRYFVRQSSPTVNVHQAYENVVGTLVRRPQLDKYVGRRQPTLKRTRNTRSSGSRRNSKARRTT